jgi:hypothetical protein
MRINFIINYFKKSIPEYMDIDNYIIENELDDDVMTNRVCILRL